MELSQKDLDWWHGLDKVWQLVFMLHLYYPGEVGMSYYKDDFLHSHRLNLDNLTEYKDILKIKALKHIDFQSWIGDYKIKDLRPLLALQQLEFLSLEEHGFSDISLLAQLPNLKKLYVSRNNIKDFSVLAELPNLERLAITGNPIAGPFDLKLISKCRKLQYLDAENYQIKDLSPLRSLRQMRELLLGDNRIFDISVLFNMTQLERLDLHGNHVFDISPLIHLARLEDLNLADNGNEFERFYLFEMMQSLQKLNVEGNGLSEANRRWLTRALPRCEIKI